MQNFLSLNRELRTDHTGVTSLLDNVPSIFALPDAKTECYFQFTINFDLNPKGTVLVNFECQKPVRIFISDNVKKPSAGNCDKTILQHEVPKAYTPFKDARRGLFKDSEDPRALFLFQHQYNEKGQLVEKQIYITVRADEGPAHGRLHVKTDVTIAQLQQVFNQPQGRSETDILRKMENMYGARSGVVRQLIVLMQENEQMRRLASFNKFVVAANEKRQLTTQGKNFVEKNKAILAKTKDQLQKEKEEKKQDRKKRIRA